MSATRILIKLCTALLREPATIGASWAVLVRPLSNMRGSQFTGATFTGTLAAR